MNVLHKDYQAEVKALPDAGAQTGRFSALVSVFNNVDLQGDRVVPGAFTKSLESWRSSGDPIPVIFSHQWDPFGIIGSARPEDVVQTERGLEMTGTLDIATNPQAAQVHSLMKRRIVKEFSFGYEVVKEKVAEDSANDLLELNLIEAGPTLKGANPATELLTVKALDKAVDESAWDGNKAMGMCASAADYRSICAGERSVGNSDERQHWALPHHYPGKGPNADGVRNALSRLPQTQGLANKEAAQSHLDAHMAEVSPKSMEVDLDDLWPELNVKAGRVISSKNEAKLRGAISAIEEVLASLGEAPTSDGAAGKSDEAKAEEPPADDKSAGTSADEPSDELLLLRARIADLAEIG